MVTRSLGKWRSRTAGAQAYNPDFSGSHSHARGIWIGRSATSSILKPAIRDRPLHPLPPSYFTTPHAPPRKMKSKTKKSTASMDSSIPSTVGASSSSIVPSASSSRGTKKFLSFKKKSEVSLPAPPPNPIELNDDGQPSQWRFGESLGPALPLSSANVLKAFSSMGKRYYHHFKEVQSSLRGDHPSSSKHFVCIQDWVLEYNNTVHDSDLSAQLTSLLASDPGPVNVDDLSGLLFPGLPEFNPKYQESLYRCWDSDVFNTIRLTRSWLPSRSPTWSYGDILCVRRMYNHASPHFPYLLEHQYPARQPMKKSTYHLDWYFDNVWLRNIRNLIVDAFELHQLWFGAAEFFNLRLDDIPTSSSICGASDVIDSLIQSGRDGALPTPSSFSKFHMPLEIIKLEDAEAQLRAVSRLLMHRTIDHIALVAGLELPRFGVDHALVGAFFSMAEVDFPFEELERHGVPLQGIRILDGKDVRPLNPCPPATALEYQAIVKEITEHDTGDARGEFLEIWRMRPVAEVKRPSPWIIKFPIGRGDESQQSRALYNDLFESCLRDVDSHMAGALARVLGPGTITLRDTVPLPRAASLSPPRDPTPQPTLPTGSMDLNLVDAVMPDFNADPSSSDEEGSIDDWNPRLQRRKARIAAAAQADPLWDAVQKDLPVAARDRASAEYGRIVPMIQVAQNKSRVWRTPLEEYLLAEWTEWHRRAPPTPCIELPQPEDSCVASSSRVTVGPSYTQQRSTRSRSPTVVGQRGRGRYDRPRSRSPRRFRPRSRSPRHFRPRPRSSPRFRRRSRSLRRRRSPSHDRRRSPSHDRRRPPSRDRRRPLSRDRHPPSSSRRHSCSPGSDLAGSRGRPVSRMPEPSGSWHAQRSRSASHGPTKVVDSFEAPQTPPGRPSAPPVIPGDSFEALQPPPDRPSAPPVVPSDSFEAPQTPPGRPSALSTFPGGAIPETADPAATNPAAADPAAANPAAANPAVADPAVADPAAADPAAADPAATDPAAADPAAADSAAADPATTEPIATDLAVVNPVGVDPAVIDPAVVDQAVVDQAVVDPVVPLATWFRIELSGVTEDVDIPRLFELFQATGLIGVRVRKNKMAKGAARNKKKVLLSFKSEQRRDAVLSLLRNSPEHRPWPFNEANTVHVDRQEALDSFRYVLCPEYVQMCYLHQQSPVDLAEMMENAPPYRDLGDLRRFHPFPLPVAATSVKTFLRYSLLELNRYPPIAVEGFTLGAPQIMDRIEFTTAWLVRTLDEEYTATRRRLAQFVRAHAIRDDRSTTPFWVPLYRTNGPYDDLVRVIGQSAMLDPDVQYSRPSRPRHMESFGYLESGLWYIDWDRSSPAPFLFLRTDEAIFSGAR
ncbi:hypothetical protein BS47DRAFT_1397041 [Hydnum rufescens UP504]|uniref:Uncharacterized protein n=1 Tax=Hydnum rufescens UP504 TaxID=1448309 RepID=A0A9P6AQV1_9AGAM|nr:hypothetical protein BS47DRAFT_1397041 [Hydnum rufescens UP504]